MYKFWSKTKGYLAFRQLVILGVLGLSTLSLAQSQKRLPASHVPDDDVIVKPVDNKVSFYQQYISSDKSEDVVKARNQIKIWSDNQIFADQYGLQINMAGSPFYVPTQREKWNYLNNKYFRYLRAKGEQPLKDIPNTWYQEYRASNEVDTIDELESRFKKKNGKSTSDKFLPEAMRSKEFNLWKQTTFIFQPRLDQGLVVVGFKTPFAYARAWVGVNGRTEVNVQQTYDSIGVRAMFNYYAQTGEYFSSVDKHIVENLYARYTRTNNPRTDVQDDTLMLLYAKQF